MFLVAWRTVWHWRWRQYFPSKIRWTSTGPPANVFQNVELSKKKKKMFILSPLSPMPCSIFVKTYLVAASYSEYQLKNSFLPFWRVCENILCLFFIFDLSHSVDKNRASLEPALYFLQQRFSVLQEDVDNIKFAFYNFPVTKLGL
jgi:hypothetical protein